MAMHNALDIFTKFLLLGLTSFGGPAAHIGYFNKRFVDELQWLPRAEFTQLLALCQFLPGPSSSQLGFAIGYKRAGMAGALAAFVGFTLPSAAIMTLAGLGSYKLAGAAPFIVLLKLLAVVVVADAVLSMARQFLVQWQFVGIAVVSFFGFLLADYPFTILLSVALLGASGLIKTPALKSQPTASFRQLQPHWGWLTLFFAGLVFAWLFSAVPFNDLTTHTAGFLQAGAWVFGGGHVVLPLLQQIFRDIATADFLTGYALAQALPGPLFSFAAYLGTFIFEQPLWGALIAVLAIFAPGFCLLLALIDSWGKLVAIPAVAGATMAINSAVVALLAAAWVDPIVSTSVLTVAELLLVCAGFWLIRVRRWSVVRLLLLFGLIGSLGVLG